ncbi:MAG: pitrilysin family protein [Vicingaceae bacterium]
MQKQPEFQTFTLSNGLRVVHKQSDRPVAHIGLFIHAGTRDENTDEHGLAHFIEHALFKGTTNRRAYHILNRLDSVGGELDAFTTKETTCLNASFLTEYYNRAIELIADVVMNSTFPEKELIKEKEVVLDEILVYQDSPADQIYDDFESQVYQGHALGKQILGSRESVLALSRKDIFNYQARLYKAENMVFSSVGNLSVKQLKNKLERYFASLKSGKVEKTQANFTPVKPQLVTDPRGTKQTHIMLGSATYGMHHPKRICMSLLNNMIGGPAMNSILNLKVRERFGYTYNLESNYATYADSGLFSIYLATDPKYVDACLQAIYKELKLLRQKPLSPNKLHLNKQQLKGQLALARESNANLMLSYGKSLLVRNEIKSLQEIHKMIDDISAEDLMEIAQSELKEDDFHQLRYVSA